MLRPRLSAISVASGLQGALLGIIFLAAALGFAYADVGQEPYDGPLPHHRLEEARTKAAAASRWAAGLNKAPTPEQSRYDAIHYGLDLTLDPGTSTVSGTVSLTAEVLDGPLNSCELDLDLALTVNATRSGGSGVGHSHAGGLLTVALDRSYAVGESFSIEVDYSGSPDESQGAFGFDSRNSQPLIWSLSEPYGARTWWPCKDSPSDKADSASIDLTVPSGLMAVSNGSFEGSNSAAGWTTWHWRERYPITTYLISVAVHPYTQQSTSFVPPVGPTMPVNAWSYPDQTAGASTALGWTVGMLGTFTNLFGAYPFLTEKYDQAQFPWGGGMEHQTATSLCCWSEYLVAHELAHQWYGDAITCNSFSHIWLNEGFATYAEALWDEDNNGSAALHSHMQNNQYFGSGTIYVPPEELGNTSRIFSGSLSYNKASWVLHMLRGVVGDTAFFDILRAYTEHPLLGQGTATTEQFQAVAESVSGLDLSNFFGNWIYQPWYPTYSYEWDAVDMGASWELTVLLQQLQTHTVYEMPVQLRVSTSAGTENFVLDNDQSSQSFVLSTSAEPLAVELDPDQWILRTIEQSVDSPTFHRGVLLVNGVDWTVYGADIVSAYADSAFTGQYPFSFWDIFPEPGGGYDPALGAPLGHGDVSPETLGEFSTVVWVGNNYQGDLPAWTNAAILSYLKKGGNVLLLCRQGQDFLSPARAGYSGIVWAEQPYNTVGTATAAHPQLLSMAPTGTQSYVSVFETVFEQDESMLLFTEDQSFGVSRAMGVWRKPLGGGTTRPSGAHFAHVAGRPYRWDRTTLRHNSQVILEELFGEPAGPTAITPTLPEPTIRLLAPSPNPFNPRVELRFELPRAAHARLSIIDARGRLVRVLFDEERPAGAGRVIWDGSDERGVAAGSGVYSVRLQSAGVQLNRKATLLR